MYFSNSNTPNLTLLLCLAPMSCTPTGFRHDTTVAAYCVLLPGKTLHISVLLTAKKIRKQRGSSESHSFVGVNRTGGGGRNKTTTMV